MRIKSILITLILFMAMFTALSALVQDRLSRDIIEQANASQAALVRTSALVDEVRLLQISFKWQVQAFKDVVLRGKDPELLERHRLEYASNQDKTAALIEAVTGALQGAEFAPVAQTVKQLTEEHKTVSAKYSDAIDVYVKLVSGKPGANGLTADEAVRGIDRKLTADIDRVALFARQMNEANATAAANAAAQMHREMSLKLYAVAGSLIMLLVIAGVYATHLVMSVLGAEPAVLRSVAEKISQGDLTTTIPSHDLDNESSLASQLLLMQMKVRSLVVGIRDETRGALDRARSGGANVEDIVNDMRALSKSMRRFKTSANEEAV